MSETPANWHKENGFEFALFPAKTAKPDSLVIYMHGIGDNAENFDKVAALFQQKMPGADVIALQGPLRLIHPDIPADQKGYAWFPFVGKKLPIAKTLLSHVFNRVSVVSQVEKFAHAQLEQRGLTEENLGLVGNSMGSIVALQTGLTGKNPAAAIVARGGTVPPFTAMRGKPAIFLQMGEEDTIFNSSPAPAKKGLKAFFAKVADKFSLRHGRSLERLRKKKINVTEKIYPGQGHMLDMDAWKDSADFIEKNIRKKQTPQPGQG